MVRSDGLCFAATPEGACGEPMAGVTLRSRDAGSGTTTLPAGQHVCDPCKDRRGACGHQAGAEEHGPEHEQAGGHEAEH